MNRFERLCRHAYELAILLGLLVLVFAPFHYRASRSLNVWRTLPGGQILLKTGEAQDLRLHAGDRLPIYRFSRAWETEIGRVNVASVAGEYILCRHDPAEFRWPMGRQGTVTALHGPGMVGINLGRDSDFKAGDQLVLFQERARVGRVRLVQVGARESVAEVLTAPAGAPLLGLTAGEFAVPTTAVVFPSQVLRHVELALIALLLMGWAAAAAAGRSVFGLARSALSHPGSAGLGTKAVWAVHFGAGVPVAWCLGRFLVFLVVYLLAQLGLAPAGLRVGPGVSGAAVLLVGSAYYAFFFATGRSPCLALWNALAYRPPRQSWKSRKWLDWGLHLVIAYAFARTLHLFLAADLAEAVRVCWPQAPIPAGGFSGWQRSLAYAMHHAPRIAKAEDFFLIARYLLWSVTIAGCLLGYAHTVLSILWKQAIRGLDFTVLGWITNAACYPLLGVVVVQVLPPFTGAGPVVAQGPWYGLMLATEFILNLLYTLSIWNLGTMFGVMTDKGVRTTGFYSFVRHPNYTLETLMFLVMGLRGFAAASNWAAGIMLYASLYWIRAEREDQFMSRSNPDYLAYREKVPWKYVPGLI